MPEVFGRGFQLYPTANASILAALPSKFGVRHLTSGGCSCDLYRRPGQSVRGEKDEHLRRKYATLGWSESKIARAVAQSKAHKRSQIAVAGIRGDVIEYLKSLCEAAGALAVVVHFYSGDVETEQVSLKHGQPCAYDEFSTRASGLLEDEVLSTVFRRAE